MIPNKMRHPIFQVKTIQDLILNKKNIIQYSRFIDASIKYSKKERRVSRKNNKKTRARSESHDTSAERYIVLDIFILFIMIG